MTLESCITAVVTPFDGQQVDWEAFGALMQFQKGEGIREVVVNGTTGESPTTTPQEQDRMVSSAANFCSAIAGTGSNDTEKTLHRSQDALDAGAGGLLLMDSYYNGPSSMELRKEYYEPVAEKFGCRVLPYVIPGRTGCELSAEDLVALHLEHPNIFGVKEATGNLDRMRRTRALSSTLAIYSGDDDITLPMISDQAIRACGVISVASNVAPKAVKRMCDLALEGKLEEAKRMHEALSPLFSAITVKTVETLRLDGAELSHNQKFRNPLPYKTLMAGLGMCKFGCRRPLGRMSAKGIEVVRNAARTVWKNNPQVLEPIEAAFGVDVGGRIENDANWGHHYG